MHIGPCYGRQWSALDGSWAPAIGWRIGWPSARGRGVAGWVAITLTQAGASGAIATREAPKAWTDRRVGSDSTWASWQPGPNDDGEGESGLPERTSQHREALVLTARASPRGIPAAVC